MDEGSLSLPPFTGYDEKSQRDYHLALRGNSLNPMIDAATPLLGMVMRLSTMNSQTMPEHLFAQVVTDVQAVEQLLQEQGYEPGVIISFRYILCTFIDEAALGNGWSNKNEWIKQSLLVHFHNEAWGGEKVFILLERLIREPKRYQDLLEFLWLCFSLGFRGRYKVAAQDQGEFEQIYRRLHAAAAVVAANNNVLDFEDIDGILHHRQAVQVGVDHQVSDVTMDKQFARFQAGKSLSGNAAVRAANPQEARFLRLRQFLKKAGVLFHQHF